MTVTVLDDKLIIAGGVIKNGEVIKKVFSSKYWTTVKCQLLDVVQLLLGIILC